MVGNFFSLLPLEGTLKQRPGGLSLLKSKALQASTQDQASLNLSWVLGRENKGQSMRPCPNTSTLAVKLTNHSCSVPYHPTLGNTAPWQAGGPSPNLSHASPGLSPLLFRPGCSRDVGSLPTLMCGHPCPYVQALPTALLQLPLGGEAAPQSDPTESLPQEPAALNVKPEM